MRPRHVSPFPRLFHRLLCEALGLQVAVHGRPAAPPALIVANHLGWCDVPALGSAVDARFVAMAEVAGWGPIGWLAAQQRTLYIDRSRRAQTGMQGRAVARVLASGETLILFPEGTTTDGRGLPFKSALFALDARPGTDIRVQPVSLAYTRLNSMPMTRAGRLRTTWIGDVGLAENLRDVLNLGPLRIDIVFHPPVDAAAFADRKALAAHCRNVVAAGYAQAMRDYISPA